MFTSKLGCKKYAIYTLRNFEFFFFEEFPQKKTICIQKALVWSQIIKNFAGKSSNQNN